MGAIQSQFNCNPMLWSIPVCRHPVEVARQLTKIESELYRSIKASELTGQGWTKADKHARAPNVLNMINRFNQVNHTLRS